MNEIRSILVTTDFSETSKKAFPSAKMLAGAFGAKILVVHVEENSVPPLVIEHIAVSLDEIQRRQKEYARQELNRLTDDEFGKELDVETMVVDGTPHSEIVRLAETLEPDLIVMATHGRGLISQALLGSTTERVVRHAPCPVLVVRDPGRES